MLPWIAFFSYTCCVFVTIQCLILKKWWFANQNSVKMFLYFSIAVIKFCFLINKRVIGNKSQIKSECDLLLEIPDWGHQWGQSNMWVADCLLVNFGLCKDPNYIWLIELCITHPDLGKLGVWGRFYERDHTFDFKRCHSILLPLPTRLVHVDQWFPTGVTRHTRER